MSRRGLTLLLATLLALGLTMSAGFARVPYVGLGAGPTYNTLGEVDGTPVIEIEGRRTYETPGHLDLTTVGVLPDLTLFEALEGWMNPDVAVVPRDAVYPPGKTDEQVNAANTALMVSSQEAATTAALRELGIPVDTRVLVGGVSPDAPADGQLRVGDVITTVDGEPVRDSTALRDLVSSREPGEEVTIGYLRDGTPGTVTLRTEPAPEGDRALIGVAPQDAADYPFEVSYQLEDVGGPSAGLMFALGVVDKLDPQPLVDGRYVAGTGEIDPDGRVGPIGGIAQKLLGARRQGATVFLTPADNCEEAVATAPDGLQLVRVETLDDALEALRALQADRPVEECADAVVAAAG